MRRNFACFSSWSSNLSVSAASSWLRTAGALLFLPAAAAALESLHVAPVSVGTADCLDWANACTIDAALAEAALGGEIWVKEGTYTPGAARTDTFTIPANVALYGGFAGTETSRSERDWVANPTILSGEIGDPGLRTDNSYHVVTITAGNSGTVLDGFTITRGHADGIPPRNQGGAVRVTGGGATLRHLKLNDNRSRDGGGGLYVASGTVVLEDSEVVQNVAAGVDCDGSGVHQGGGSITLKRVELRSNTGRLGGGFLNYGGTATLVDVLFSSNSVTVNGGGAFFGGSSNSTVTRARFEFNSTQGYGGGLAHDAPVALTDVEFVRNFAVEEGGGIYSQADATVVNLVAVGNRAKKGAGVGNYGIFTNQDSVYSNLLLVGNSASIEGGGFYNEMEDAQGSLLVTNATIVANDATVRGGGFLNYGECCSATTQNAQLVNSIVRGNTAGGFSPQIATAFDEFTVSHSDVEGGYTGTGNFDLAVTFLATPSKGGDATWGTGDDDYGDLRFGPGAPVIDVGDATDVAAAVDLDRNARRFDDPNATNGGIGTPPVDLGAYEYGPLFTDGFETETTSRWSSTTGG